MKGEGAGTRSGAHTEEAGLASEGLRLRSEMQRAVDEERRVYWTLDPRSTHRVGSLYAGIIWQ